MSESVAIRKTSSILDEMNQIQDRIMRRAHEIFEHNRGLFGRDLDNWLEAERELLWSAAVMKSLSLRALPFPRVPSIRRYQPTGSLSSVRSQQQEQKSSTLQRRVLVLCQHSDHQNHSDSLLVTECLPGCPVAKGKRERLPTYPNLVMNGATLSGSPTKHRASSLIMICNAPHPHSRAVPNNRSFNLVRRVAGPRILCSVR